MPGSQKALFKGFGKKKKKKKKKKPSPCMFWHTGPQKRGE